MGTRGKHIRAAMLAVGAGQLLLAEPVWAQAPARITGEGNPMLGWAVAGGITVIVCCAAFLNSKRSHLN